MEQELDFYKVVQPLHRVNKWLGLSGWSLLGEVGTKERKYKILTRDIFWNFSAIVLLLTSCVVHCKYCSDSFTEVQSFSYVLLKYSNYAIIFIHLLTTNLCKKRVINVIAEVTIIDDEIRTITKRNLNYSNSQRRVICCMMFWYSMVITKTLLMTNLAIQHSLDEEFHCALVTLLSVIFNDHFNCYIFTMLAELRQRLLKINQCIDMKLRETTSLVIYSDHIKSLIHIYNTLASIGKEVSTIFQTILLGKIILCFVFTLTAGFWISTKNYKGEQMLLSMEIGLFYWIFTNVTDVGATVYFFVSFADEAKKTVHLMEDVQKAVGKCRLAYKQVELFSLHVYLENFKFTVFGFFPLDWTLLHSMMAGIATYLVIFHQFSNLEKHTQGKL